VTTTVVLLADETPDDAEELVIAWMQPVRPSAMERLTTDPLPFTLVTHIAGTEDTDMSTAEPVVSVHTLCDRNLGLVAAKNECKTTHSRMLRLAKHIDGIVLTSGRTAYVDYVDVTESPRWEPYGDDQILQKIGRYALGLTFVAGI
jgi:hypothetical protein